MPEPASRLAGPTQGILFIELPKNKPHFDLRLPF
jgi:hypothetical protein